MPESHDRGRDFRRHQGRRGVWTAGVLDIRRGSERPEDAEGGEKIPSAPEGVERFRLHKETSMSRSWTFGRKLGASFAVVVGLTLLMGVVSAYSLRAVVESKDQVITVTGGNL